MFRGSSSHTLDDKGRIIIPTRFRNIIQTGGGNTLMLTQRDGCLYGYTMNEWSTLEQEIKSMANISDAFRRFLRIFVGSAQECTLDKQGRVLIPQSLREYGELEKDVVLVGVLNHFEIWSQDKWARENELLKKDMQQVEVRDEIAKLGL